MILITVRAFRIGIYFDFFDTRSYSLFYFQPITWVFHWHIFEKEHIARGEIWIAQDSNFVYAAKYLWNILKSDREVLKTRENLPELKNRRMVEQTSKEKQQKMERLCSLWNRKKIEEI